MTKYYSSVAPLVAIALGATVVALPVSFGKVDGIYSLGAKVAVAKDKDGGNDRGKADDDHGRAAIARADDDHGNGNGNAGGNGRGNANGRGNDTTVVVDNRGPGNALDRGNAPAERTEARATALAEARQRYEEAIERKKGPAETEVADIGKRERTLTDDEARAVLGRGWQARQDNDGEFRNHGERVRTFVAIAKALGFEASVGAMQANFGTAAEGFTKPGNGPTDWQAANLDVNKDGKVNELDLIAALNPPPPVVTPPPTTTPPTTTPTTPPVTEAPPATTTPPTTTTPPATTTPTTTPVAEAPTTTTPTTTPPTTTTPTPTPPATTTPAA